jgi:hypothetical protein
MGMVTVIDGEWFGALAFTLLLMMIVGQHLTDHFSK